jgi:PAS domain S-box-containing protein
MTVRRKIVLILIAFIALMFAAVFLLFRVVLQRNVDALETTRVRDAIERAVSALDNEASLLDRFTHDYAAWDDTYAFVLNPRPSFVESNLPVSAFTINHCDFMVFLDAAGGLVYQKGFDTEAGRKIPVPLELDVQLAPGGPLLRLKTPESSARGYLALSGEVFMVAARPILTSEEKGPIRGTLVTGRKIDQKYFDQLSTAVGLALTLKGPNAENSGTAPWGTGPDADRAIRFLDSRTVEGSALFPDLAGRPAFVLAFRQDRPIRSQFRRVQIYSLTVMAVFALAGFWLSLFTIDRLVTSRLGSISRILRETGRTGDLKNRVEVRGGDELAVLGRALNGLLDALHRQVAEIRAAEDEVKKSETKYRSLFEASTDAAFLETLDGRIIDCNPAALQLLGYTREEMLRLNVVDLLPPEDRPHFPEMAARLAGQGAAFFETANIAKRGERIPIEASLRLARIGETDFVVTFVHDLRQIRRHERIRQAVFNISEAASAAGDLGEIFRRIHEAVTDIIPTRNFYIALYDSEADRLSFPYFIDEVDEPPSPLPPGRGLTAYVLRHGEPLLAGSADIAALVRAGELDVGGTVPVVWLGVPLKTESAVIGVMAVQSYQTVRLFDDEEKAVFQFMSDQAAMAIERVRARERLQSSLLEKEALLREVHYRVKNNMQLISSMFNLQAGEISDPKAVDKLRESQARIRSMSLIHEKLYRSKDLARIGFADYIRSLAAHLFHFWRTEGSPISLETDLEELTLDINTAIPCGLIINEILSNALEHAFPGGRPGRIHIGLRAAAGNAYILDIRDDGIGLPDGVDPGRTETLGLQIIALLVRQLEGSLAIDRSAGTAYTIRFREIRYKPRI